jgi:hypothetical protein
MRHLIISALLLAACNFNQNNPSSTTPAVGSPSDISAPTTPEEEGVGVAEVDERVDCPQLSFDADVLARITNELLNNANRSKFLICEYSYGDNQSDVRVVFTSNDVLYNIWYPGDMISVWEQPEGTHSEELIQNYTDNLVDGCVNFGIMVSGKKGDDSSRRLMRWNDASGDEEGVEENHGYWQGRYVFAMRGLADTLGIK